MISKANNNQSILRLEDYNLEGEGINQFPSRLGKSAISCKEDKMAT